MHDEYHKECSCKVARYLSTPIGTTSTRLLGPNPKRRALILSPTSLNRCTVSLGMAAVLDQGLTLYPGTQAPPLTYGTYGEALCQDVFAIFENVGETLGYIEIMA